VIRDQDFKVAIFFEMSRNQLSQKTVQDKTIATIEQRTLIGSHIRSIEWCHFQ